jgi:NAD(P)-dependent dehydrogenase (short-subunit alcohol dehydrogenase family)
MSSDFSLDGRVAIITGGAGLLGTKHAEAIAAAGGIPVVADIREKEAEQVAGRIGAAFAVPAAGIRCDVTDAGSVAALVERALILFGRIDILVNNAANNPRVEDPGGSFSRLEQFPIDQWLRDLAVGLTGAFLCAKAVGVVLAEQRRGVIINISSEYGLIAPDQRLYGNQSDERDEQPVKPVTYSVVKAGLHGLTLYLSTYWADRGVRANTITLGGVENGQTASFVERASWRVPLGRMARADEFQGALVYLCSDAASFVNGANLVVDGGKTVW